MRIERGRICLGIPTELPAARMWWLLAAMTKTDFDFVLEFAEEIAAAAEENSTEEDELFTSAADAIAEPNKRHTVPL